MSRPITPTPVLDPKSAEAFLDKVENGKKTAPVPVPKLKVLLEKLK